MTSVHAYQFSPLHNLLSLPAWNSVGNLRTISPVVDDSNQHQLAIGQIFHHCTSYRQYNKIKQNITCFPWGAYPDRLHWTLWICRNLRGKTIGYKSIAACSVLYVAGIVVNTIHHTKMAQHLPSIGKEKSAYVRHFHTVSIQLGVYCWRT